MENFEILAISVGIFLLSLISGILAGDVVGYKRGFDHSSACLLNGNKVHLEKRECIALDELKGMDND